MSQTAVQVQQVTRGQVARQMARWAMPMVFVVLVLASAATTPSFLTFDNLRGVLTNTAITGIAAVGMTAVTLSGNIFSLGVGQSAMLASILFMAVVASGTSPALGAVLALVALLVLGLLQSLVIAAGLNPVVTTLAFGTVIYGAVAAITGGAVISAPLAGIDWLAGSDIFGIPLPVWVFAAFTVVVWLVVERTVPGRRLVLVGANRNSAIMSGISMRSTTLWAFAIMSFGLAIAGVLSASQLGQVTTDNLSELTVDTVAAVLVGGTAITGGEGSAARSATGALIIVVLQNVLLLHGLSSGVRVCGEGVLVVLVVAALHLARQAAAR